MQTHNTDITPYYQQSVIWKGIIETERQHEQEERPAEDCHVGYIGQTPGVYIVGYGPTSDRHRHCLGEYDTPSEAEQAVNAALPLINPHNATLHRHRV